MTEYLQGWGAGGGHWKLGMCSAEWGSQDTIICDLVQYAWLRTEEKRATIRAASSRAEAGEQESVSRRADPYGPRCLVVAVNASGSEVLASVGLPGSMAPAEYLRSIYQTLWTAGMGWMSTRESGASGLTTINEIAVRSNPRSARVINRGIQIKRAQGVVRLRRPLRLHLACPFRVFRAGNVRGARRNNKLELKCRCRSQCEKCDYRRTVGGTRANLRVQSRVRIRSGEP